MYIMAIGGIEAVGLGLDAWVRAYMVKQKKEDGYIMWCLLHPTWYRSLSRFLLPQIKDPQDEVLHVILNKNKHTKKKEKREERSNFLKKFPTSTPLFYFIKSFG